MTEKNNEIYKEKILSKDVDFFQKKIKNYKNKKIFHISILGFAIYHSSYEVIEQIIKNNGLVISLNLMEEDGFNTFFYLLDRDCSLEEKIKITELFKKYCNIDFSFKNEPYNFVAFCIAKNQIELLMHINNENNNIFKDELILFKEDIKEKLYNNGKIELANYFEML